MAVVSVKQTMPFGAGGQWQSTITDETEEFTESYIVELDGADSPRNSIIVARNAAGLPSVGDVYSSNTPQLVAREKQVTSTKDFKTFIVTVEYSKRGTVIPVSDDPFDDPWVIDFPDEIEKRIVEKTVNDLTDSSGGGGYWADDETPTGIDEPIVNAAGEFFDTPPEEDFYPGVIVMSKNVNKATISLEEMTQFRGSVNDRPMTVAGTDIPRWRGRLIGFAAIYQDDRGKEYYRITYKVKVLDVIWVRKFMNRGWKYRPGGIGTPLKLCKLSGGIDPKKPMILSEDGTSHEGLDTNIDANYIVFGTIPEQNWNNLTTNMPTTL